MDLAKMGYDAKWGVLGAVDAGAPHKRDRIWILAHTNCERLEKFDSASESDKTQQYPGENTEGRGESWWQLEPGLDRVANGVAHRVDRLKAIGNGQVPAVVKLAWENLSKF
jgi:DNA (cytosine-5)-methyltransferase 1